jgi:hypothetical protein
MSADKGKVKRAEGVLRWVSESLDGLDVPGMATKKHLQLAVPCFHAVIRHHQAVVLLVEEELEGSALALIRVVVEAYARGAWLLHSASPAEVDAAGRDVFPGFSRVVAGLNPAGSDAAFLTPIKTHAWARFCSYTHTGFQQIGARLTPNGVDEAFEPEEIAQALSLSSICSLAAVVQIASAGENRDLVLEATKRVKEELLAM